MFEKYMEIKVVIQIKEVFVHCVIWFYLRFVHSCGKVIFE